MEHLVLNRLAVAEAQIDDFFVGDIQRNIFEGDSSDIIELFLGGDHMIFEGDRGSGDILVNGYLTLSPSNPLTL